MASDIHQDIHTSPIDRLPREVVELILSKCPVKSVVRFKSVSKSWQSTISSPHISKILQSKLSENLRNKFFIWERPAVGSDDDLYLISLQEDGRFRRKKVLGYPSRKFFLVTSCNGLILLYSNPNKYILWNPLIGKHIRIPSVRTKPKAYRNLPRERQYFYDPGNPVSLGARLHNFYYDSTVDDHKIVSLYENCYTVYSCKNGSCDVKDFPSNFSIYDCDSISDGCYYRKRGDEIEYLDTRDGEVKKLRPPNDVESLTEVELWEVSGRLCLFGWIDHHRRLQLWVLEKNGSFENSWRKLICLEKEEADSFDFWPVCLSNEGLLVLWSNTRYGKFKCFIYNPRENSFQKDYFDWGHTMKYHPYSETLYMPSSNVLA